MAKPVEAEEKEGRRFIFASDSTFTNPECWIVGDNNKIRGHMCMVTGNNNRIIGYNVRAQGDHNQLFGTRCWALGNENSLHGPNCEAYGNDNRLSGSNCEAHGMDNVVIGNSACFYEDTDSAIPGIKERACRPESLSDPVLPAPPSSDGEPWQE